LSTKTGDQAWRLFTTTGVFSKEKIYSLEQTFIRVESKKFFLCTLANFADDIFAQVDVLDKNRIHRRTYPNLWTTRPASTSHNSWIYLVTR